MLRVRVAIRDANYERQGAVWPVRNIVSIDRLAKMAGVGTLPIVFVRIGSTMQSGLITLGRALTRG